MDPNSSSNIEVLGRSEYFSLLSASQSLRFDKTPSTNEGEASNKLRSFN
ncbi:MAG: hypothetical protein JRN66_07230 [Nitrososphaerota archaeon]|nr:hypothetical protein [Nitrososphaerota archaeon]